MRIASYRFSLSTLALISLISNGHADLEYRIKNENVEVFRTMVLAPPPLAVLHRGDGLHLIKKGQENSLVQTEGGIKGWIANQDLLMVASPKGEKIYLQEQKIVPDGEFAHAFDINVPPGPVVEVATLDRTFAGEVIEPIDREQMEMRHDEN